MSTAQNGLGLSGARPNYDDAGPVEPGHVGQVTAMLHDADGTAQGVFAMAHVNLRIRDHPGQRFR